MDDVFKWLGAIALAIGIVNALWAWFRTSARELAAKLEAVERETAASLKEIGEVIDKHDTRIQCTESELAHLPTKDSISDLRLTLAALDGRLGRFEVEIESVSRTARRIEEHLIKAVP